MRAKTASGAVEMSRRGPTNSAMVVSGAAGAIWIAGCSGHGPWLLSIAHSGVAAEIGSASVSPVAGPGVATLVFPMVKELHVALDRVYKLAMSLPEAPLDRFKAKTANLPRTTEAERWVIQRIGQDVFRAALLDYWDSRRPLTGITDNDRQAAGCPPFSWRRTRGRPMKRA
jgi:hypothetical protein